MRVLITGMGGSGKSTVVLELSAQGKTAIDLDDTDLSFWINKQTGERAKYIQGAGKEWIQDHSWRCDVEGLKNFLSSFPANQDVYIAGKISKSQMKDMKSLFDRIFVLIPSDTTLDSRLRDRTNNYTNFGKEKDERIYVLQDRKLFEAACLEVSAVSINANLPVKEIVNKVLVI